jgi:hypothetical protein
MTQRVGQIMALALALVWLAADGARADDFDYDKDTWPLEVTKRPLTLAAGMLEIGGNTLVVNLSDGSVGDPISLAPSIHYGVTQELSVGITHQTGICVAGDLCGKAYNDLGLEALYALMRGGNFQVAARGGFVLPSLDPFALGLAAGIRARIRAGNIAVVAEPGVYIGLAERDSFGDRLEVPVLLQFQIQPQTALQVRTGLSGPLEGFGDGKSIPLGIGGIFAINNRLDFGAELLLPDISNDGRFDARVLFARVLLRL